MRTVRMLIAAIWLLALRPAWAGLPGPMKDEPASAFTAKPYVQMGHDASRNALTLLWHTPDADADWSVDYQTGADRGWASAKAPRTARSTCPASSRTGSTGPS